MLKITVLFLLTSSAAFAMPQVGDQATFDLTLTKDGQTYNAVAIEELVQFDAAKNQYLERETQRMGGQPDQTSDTWKDASELITDARADQLLAQCADAGGTPQTISVPAGSFATCALNVNDDNGNPSGKVWLGKVPFGVVHAEINQNGTTTVLSLRAFVEKQ